MVNILVPEEIPAVKYGPMAFTFRDPSVPEKLGYDGHGHKWRVFPDNRIDFVK